MKKLLIITLLLPLLAFTPANNNKQSDNAFRKWQKLGVRKASKGADHDVLMVTAQKGAFRKLKLKVTHSRLWVHTIRIVFRNGTSQNIIVNQNFRPGDVRIIDLPGNRRIINRIIFQYHTKFYARGRARMHIWGKH